MEDFHKKVYDIIFKLFKDKNLKSITERVFLKFQNQFFLESAARYHHQKYPGGLADHTAVVALEAYFLALSRPYLEVDTDKVLVCALCHDFDKLGKYLTKPKVFRDDDDVCTFLHQLIVNFDDEFVNGIVFAHGGWSRWPDGDERRGTHLPIAILVHDADMTGSQQLKTKEDTRKLILDSLWNIAFYRMVTIKSKQDCPFCGSTLLSKVKMLGGNPPIMENDALDCSNCKVSFLTNKRLISLKI